MNYTNDRWLSPGIRLCEIDAPLSQSTKDELESKARWTTRKRGLFESIGEWPGTGWESQDVHDYNRTVLQEKCRINCPIKE